MLAISSVACPFTVLKACTPFPVVVEQNVDFAPAKLPPKRIYEIAPTLLPTRQ